jgi:hypothetical protein
MKKNYFRFGAILVAIAVSAALFLSGVSSASARPFTTDFTGTSTCVDVPNTGVTMVADGKLHIKGLVNICSDKADDPRVSGTDTIVINAILDLNDNLSGPMWGSASVENEGGSWEGFWTGKRTSDGFAYIRMSAHGLGDYKGMQAWWDLERLSPDPTHPYSMSGHILDPGE